MRFIVLLFSMMSFFAMGKGVQITASGGSPIPNAYSASDSQSKALECQGNVVEIMNESSTKLAFEFGTSSTAPTTDYKFVPAGPGSWTVAVPKGGMGSGTYLYIRSAGSAITSGTYTASCTFEELIQ